MNAASVDNLFLLQLPVHTSMVWLVGAAVAWYGASRALGAAFQRRFDSVLLGGVGHFVPIAAFAVFATVAGQSALALSVAFSVATASIWLTVGIIALSGRVDRPRHHRLWLMLLPTTAIAALVGVHVRLEPVHLIVLAAQAALLCWLAHERKPRDGVPESNFIDVRAKPRASLLLWIGGIALTIVATPLGVKTGMVADEAMINIPATLLGTMLLTPALVLPVIGVGSQDAGRRDASTGVTRALVVAALCLTALPAMCILTQLILAHVVEPGVTYRLSGPIAFALRPPTEPLVVSAAATRIDTLLCLLGAIWLVPVALGRWSIDRAEGLIMTLVYVAYMVVSVATQV